MSNCCTDYTALSEINPYSFYWRPFIDFFHFVFVLWVTKWVFFLVVYKRFNATSNCWSCSHILSSFPCIHLCVFYVIMSKRLTFQKNKLSSFVIFLNLFFFYTSYCLCMSSLHNARKVHPYFRFKVLLVSNLGPKRNEQVFSDQVCQCVFWLDWLAGWIVLSERFIQNRTLFLWVGFLNPYNIDVSWSQYCSVLLPLTIHSCSISVLEKVSIYFTFFVPTEFSKLLL